MNNVESLESSYENLIKFKRLPGVNKTVFYFRINEMLLSLGDIICQFASVTE